MMLFVAILLATLRKRIVVRYSNQRAGIPIKRNAVSLAPLHAPEGDNSASAAFAAPRVLRIARKIAWYKET